jgi:hypothetical protein
MTFDVDVKAAVDYVTEEMRKKRREVDFVTAVALTRTAKRVEAAELHEMKDVFDRPTPFTLSGTFVRPATVSNLSAEVKLKDFAGKGTPAAKYLAAQLQGGTRRPKRFERALQSLGALPPGYRAIPGAGAKVDAYGNMDRGQIVQILSYFRAFPEAGYKANMTDKRKAALARGSKTQQGYAYFIGRPGDRLPLGIYQRVYFARGTAIKPILIFVSSAMYEAIFDFDFVARITVDAAFPEEFQRALAEAEAAAR